jgi:transposase
LSKHHPPGWPAFVGVDWGGSEHQLCVLDTTGTQLTQQRVTHDVAGLAELDTTLAEHGEALPIAVERAEGVLVEHLQSQGHTVFPVSPRIAARARERYRVAAVKDDRLDAYVLADTLRHEHHRWRALSIPSPLMAEIRALTRDRDRLQQTQQAIESQLRAILEAYHPAPARLFSSVDRQITLHFVLDYPTPAAASRIKATRMSGFLTRHHYTGRVSGQVLAERLRENLLAASTGTVAGKSYSAQSFARLLQLLGLDTIPVLLVDAPKEVDRVIDQIVENDQRIELSMTVSRAGSSSPRSACRRRRSPSAPARGRPT